MREDGSEGQVVQVPGLEHERAIGTPHVTTSATWTWLVEGYRRALARLREATGQRAERETFIPLFETLNWAVAIIDYSTARGPRIGDEEVLRGLRFVRNRVQHQWADALEPRDVPNAQVVQAAKGSRIVMPPTSIKWFWKPPALLPDAPPGHEDRTGEAAYSDHLAGQPVSLALDRLESLL